LRAKTNCRHHRRIELIVESKLGAERRKVESGIEVVGKLDIAAEVVRKLDVEVEVESGIEAEFGAELDAEFEVGNK